MPRNPFRLKNLLEDEKYEASENLRTVEFDEGWLTSNHEGRVERGINLVRETKYLGFFVFLLSAILGSRLFYLAVLKHDLYREIALGNRLRIEYLSAPRGAIYDVFGRILAANQPSFELVATPLDFSENLDDRKKVIEDIADIFAMNAQEIESLLRNYDPKFFHSIAVKTNLSREEVLIFSEREAELRGFRVVNLPSRQYESPLPYAHLLGYVGKISAEEYKQKVEDGYLYNDFIGKTGLEAYYEKFLRGKFGERQVEVDARGLVKKVYGIKDYIPGNNLYLNVDAGLQEKLFSSLSGRVSGMRTKRAVAIAMDPKSGKILAYLSLPAFDINDFVSGISPEAYQKLQENPQKPLFNRGIAGTYPPGSTIKPVVAAAALEEGVIEPKSTIYDKGEIVIPNPFGGPNYYFYGYNRKVLGYLDVKTAIALSSDIFFYIIGGGYEPWKIKGLGIENLAAYYRRFKFDQILGIDLPGEKPGLVPTPEWKKQIFGDDPIASKWYLGNTYHVSIGQGDVLVSPLQVLSWTAAIANGGKIYRPYIVDRVEDGLGKVLAKNEPAVIGEVGIDEKYLRVVREGMRQAVTEGTVKILNDVPVAVAGKTGTAQFDAKNPYRTHAWFTAFAPFDDPQIAITVLIEDGGEGSLSAAPVVRDALDWWVRNRYQK